MDNTTHGHHRVYMETLREIPNVENISRDHLVEQNAKKLFSYIFSRLSIFKYTFKKVPKNEAVHLLYMDNLYTVGFLMRFPKDIDVIGTLHHFPNSKNKIRLLKIFSKKLKYIIVHSEFIGEQLRSNNILNYIVIDYPAFHSSFHLKANSERNRDNQDKSILSVLGGTRFDKGLDILLDSLSLLDDEVKNRIVINISGREETFKKEFIQKKGIESGVEIQLNLRTLSDQEFEDNILKSDAIIIPYRKIFTGNSGPMTEGVYNQKPIIGTDHGNIGYLIRSYKLGFTFDSENPSSLANSISRFVKAGWTVSEESQRYQKKLSVYQFIEEHKRLYSQITTNFES